MTPTIILHTDAPGDVRAIVAAAHPDLTIHTCDSYAALPALLTATQAGVVYTVRFAGATGFPRDALLNASVRWISVGGSGTDHLAPWNPAQVSVTNAAGAAAGMLAEYVIGMMLAFTLNLRGFAKAQAAGRWSPGKMTPIAGKTVLIIGLGHTGQATAQKAKALGLQVLGLRAHPQPTPDVDEVHPAAALISLLPRADFIVVCVPLTPATRGMINAAALAQAKPGAVLIDVSRGGVVDESALLAALQTGGVRGAALDVFATEPLPAGHPFWSMENVIITPHSASRHDGWAAKAVTMFAENLTRYRRGEPLRNIVDPVRGY